MRLSRKTHRHREAIEEAFTVSEDDKGIATYFGVNFIEVRALRILYNEKLAAAMPDEAIASENLRDAIQKLFRKWERENGFKKGAAELLLPAGYVPMMEAA